MSALQAVDLYRFYHAGESETLALRGVSFELERGSMTAVVGPSGSGKSTLLACLAGLDEPDGGRVLVDGKPISHRSESERAALRAGHIGVLLQSGNLFTHLNLDGNLRVAQALAGRARTRGAASDRADAASDRAAVLDAVGLPGYGRRYPSTLSGGEAARVGLAVALVTHPIVLLADEPTAEVDAANEKAILAMLRARRDAGMAVLIATHSDGIAAAADRVLRMRDGVLVA